MSALNGVVQAEAVHLFTDGAIYTRDGRLRGIGAKVTVLPAANMAIGWSGFGSVPRLRTHLRRHKAETAQDVLEALPSVVADMAADNVTGPFRAHPDEAGVQLLVALWHPELDEPQLWAIHSDSRIFGPQYRPCTLVRLRRGLDVHPGTENAVFGRPVDFEDPASFDPVVDGLALLEMLRREPWETEDGPRYFVGGFAQLTTVSRRRIETRELARWPDRIGRLIEPDAPARLPGWRDRLAWAGNLLRRNS